MAALEKARERGSIAALRVLAALTAAGLVGDGGWTAALAMMREACEQADAPALREIAALLLALSPRDQDGAAFLHEAAKRDAFAAALVERRRIRSLETAAGPISIDRSFEKIACIEMNGEREEICKKPKVTVFKGVFATDLCAHLMGASVRRLKREQVLGGDGRRRTDPHRTSWGAIIGFGFADIPSVFAGRQMARLAEIPYSHGEPLSILRYRPGQEYRPHHDFLSGNDPDLKAHGQRLKTALAYLNDGYAGGETHFLSPDIRFAGKTGDVLIFSNVDDGGEPDFSARHAGLAIGKGEKWLASLWLRDRPFCD